jgi:spore germination cell wall hydrolase CwlJ-like protein
MGVTPAVLCLALAIYHEARGQPLHAQFAVAHVAVNRAHDPRWPADICAVVRQPKQFAVLHPPRDTAAWALAQIIAGRALDGELPDPTHGALWFHEADSAADWTIELTPVRVHGPFIFWRDNEN